MLVKSISVEEQDDYLHQGKKGAPVTIYWGLLLKTEDVRSELERLYSSMSVSALADYLGVARSTLRCKFKELNIKVDPPGGSHPRFPKEDLPDNLVKMTPAQIVSLTGYSFNYARKLKRRLKDGSDNERGDAERRPKLGKLSSYGPSARTSNNVRKPRNGSTNNSDPGSKGTHRKVTGKGR